MTHLFKALPDTLKTFVREEDGAQVVEYALIIAVVSIALVLAIKGLSDGSFTDMIDRVSTCLKPGGTCA